MLPCIGRQRTWLRGLRRLQQAQLQSSSLVGQQEGSRSSAAGPPCLQHAEDSSLAYSPLWERRRSSSLASTSEQERQAWGPFKADIAPLGQDAGLQQLREVEVPPSSAAAAAAAVAVSGLVGVGEPWLARTFNKGPTTEVKMESQVIFDSCWRRFEDKFGQKFQIPREIVWLNGAPGSGKGVNTPHILKTRGLNRAIHISRLLRADPGAKQLMDRGEMITDTMVGDHLLEAILHQGDRDEHGAIVDGFPRTAFQVDYLKLLYEKLEEVHYRWAETALAVRFPRPSFKVVVLYVDEDTSIKRQMERATIARAHNKRVADAGANCFWEERATDVDVEMCRKRYEIFKSHYTAILRLKQFFPFHLIDAMGSMQETQEQITQELRYQSSLDLNEATYTLIRRLPLAKDLVRSARQQLVKRLDQYMDESPDLFEQVVHIIADDVMPIAAQAGLAGQAQWSTRSSFFSLNTRTVDMFIDILADRGFSVSYVRSEVMVPTHFDTATGRITNRREPVHTFKIMFDTRGVRDAFKALEIAARVAEVGSEGPNGNRISQSFIPDHSDHEIKLRKEAEEESQAASAALSGTYDGSGTTGTWSSMRRCTKKGPTNCGHVEDVVVMHMAHPSGAAAAAASAGAGAATAAG